MPAPVSSDQYANAIASISRSSSGVGEVEANLLCTRDQDVDHKDNMTSKKMKTKTAEDKDEKNENNGKRASSPCMPDYIATTCSFLLLSDLHVCYNYRTTHPLESR